MAGAGPADIVGRIPVAIAGLGHQSCLKCAVWLGGDWCRVWFDSRLANNAEVIPKSRVWGSCDVSCECHEKDVKRQPRHCDEGYTGVDV